MVSGIYAGACKFYNTAIYGTLIDSPHSFMGQANACPAPINAAAVMLHNVPAKMSNRWKSPSLSCFYFSCCCGLITDKAAGTRKPAEAVAIILMKKG